MKYSNRWKEMEDDSIYLGESYSLSIILNHGRISGFRDNIFKKQFEINDEFESLRKIEISDSVVFDAVSDKRDRIKVLSL